MNVLIRILCGLLLAATAAAQQAPAPRGEPEQAIEPAVERRDITIPRIKARDIELGGFVGRLGIDSFSDSMVFGARASYFVSDEFFIEGEIARSSVSDEQFRDFGLPLFDEEEETVLLYNAVLGYNVLPGEFFLGRNRAWRSNLYLVAGLGNTRLAGEDYFTFVAGIGLRLLPTDWLTLRVDFREYIFETDILGEPEITYNPALTLGLGVYF